MCDVREHVSRGGTRARAGYEYFEFREAVKLAWHPYAGQIPDVVREVS
jgi:hypothetical protein